MTGSDDEIVSVDLSRGVWFCLVGGEWLPMKPAGGAEVELPDGVFTVRWEPSWIFTFDPPEERP